MLCGGCHPVPDPIRVAAVYREVQGIYNKIEIN